MRRAISSMAMLAAGAALMLGTVGARHASAATVQVDATNSGATDLFSPAIIDITVGDTVQWNFIGDNPHTVTSTSAESFDSGLTPKFPGDPAFTHTFNVAGSFSYRCIVHTAMTGTVNVQAPTATPEPAATDTPEPTDTPNRPTRPRPRPPVPSPPPRRARPRRARRRPPLRQPIPRTPPRRPRRPGASRRRGGCPRQATARRPQAAPERQTQQGARGRCCSWVAGWRSGCRRLRDGKAAAAARNRENLDTSSFG